MYFAVLTRFFNLLTYTGILGASDTVCGISQALLIEEEPFIEHL